MEDCRPCFLFTKHFFLISTRHVIIKPNNPPPPPWASYRRALACIFFTNAYELQYIQYIEVVCSHLRVKKIIQLGIFKGRMGSRQTHKLNPTMLTVDHSYPQTLPGRQTYIRTFLAIYSSLLPSFSPTRLSGECLSVIRCGLGGQIAIYSLPVGEVCVSRL